jgi:hypothetical protein
VRRLLVGATALVAGCTWSNSLYHARRLSESALRAEREERTFDATSFWGQVAVKAESAYTRSPGGDGGTEALWLRGRALARLGDCEAGRGPLEQATLRAGDVDWRDALRLELARCRVQGGAHGEAVELLLPVLRDPGTDDATRQAAALLAARILGALGQWEEALPLLADGEGRQVTWQRAITLAQLGRLDEAMVLVEPWVAEGDTLTPWVDLVRAGAARADVAVLLERLGTLPSANDTTRGAWLLAAAEAGMRRDEAGSRATLERVAGMPRSPAVSRARVLLAERLIAEAHDSLTLARAVAALEGVGGDDPTARVFANLLAGWGRTILRDVDSLAAGEAEGDLAMVYDAMVARDTLHAPRLASWLLLRLERRWPESPYVPKALLMRMPLEPDSLEALHARLQAAPASPYLALMQGRDDPQYRELEFALDFYLGERFAAARGAVQGEQ